LLHCRLMAPSQGYLAFVEANVDVIFLSRSDVLRFVAVEAYARRHLQMPSLNLLKGTFLAVREAEGGVRLRQLAHAELASASMAESYSGIGGGQAAGVVLRLVGGMRLQAGEVFETNAGGDAALQPLQQLPEPGANLLCCELAAAAAAGPLAPLTLEAVAGTLWRLTRCNQVAEEVSSLTALRARLRSCEVQRAAALAAAVPPVPAAMAWLQDEMEALQEQIETREAVVSAQLGLVPDAMFAAAALASLEGLSEGALHEHLARAASAWYAHAGAMCSGPCMLAPSAVVGSLGGAAMAELAGASAGVVPTSASVGALTTSPCGHCVAACWAPGTGGAGTAPGAMWCGRCWAWGHLCCCRYLGLNPYVAGAAAAAAAAAATAAAAAAGSRIDPDHQPSPLDPPSARLPLSPLCPQARMPPPAHPLPARTRRQCTVLLAHGCWDRPRMTRTRRALCGPQMGSASLTVGAAWWRALHRPPARTRGRARCCHASAAAAAAPALGAGFPRGSAAKPSRMRRPTPGLLATMMAPPAARGVVADEAVTCAAAARVVVSAAHRTLAAWKDCRRRRVVRRMPVLVNKTRVWVVGTQLGALAAQR
jgi:hypothetical protein